MSKTSYQTITDLRASHGSTVLENERTILTKFGRPVALVTQLSKKDLQQLTPFVEEGTTESLGLPAIAFQNFYKKFNLEIKAMRKAGYDSAVIIRSNYNGPGYKFGHPVAKAIVTLLDDVQADKLLDQTRSAADGFVDRLLGQRKQRKTRK